MGTQLFEAGLDSGDCPELLNVERPELVAGIHEAYLAAGAEVVLTNTFGGNRFRLGLHGCEGRVHELNRAAAEIARGCVNHQSTNTTTQSVVVRQSEPPISKVAGSMGPTGELIEPLGEMTVADCAAAFAEQAAALADGWADLLWIETMSALDEVLAAVTGARSVTDLPIVVTMSFDTAGRTMMGTSGAEVSAGLVDLGLAGLGANCGANLADTEAAVAEIASGLAGTETLVVAKPNAGVPEWHDHKLVYDATPEVMGQYAKRMLDAGAVVIGGCCGSTPSHIAALREALESSS